jgi:hypothetical protein
MPGLDSLNIWHPGLGQRLPRRVYLLLRYIDLHRRSHLADLLKRAAGWYRLGEAGPQSCASCLMISAKR